ncbi:MAG: hypothetical protein NUV77_24400 [Thermoguttaceae bacterium]|jgi:hypothetical protein|nr:hypothetical protein [Thermoguttaceae bacterium]
MRIRRASLLAVVIFVALSLVDSGPVTCAETSSAPTDAGIRFVLMGLKDSRERLTSGVFRATGYLEQTVQEPVLRGEISIFCAFDFANGFLRFDRIEPGWVAPPREAKPPEGKIAKAPLVLRQLGGRFARNAKASVEWSEGARFAALRRVEEDPPASVRPFDVRLVGLVNWGTLENGKMWEFGFPKLQSRASGLVQESETLYRVSWVDEKETAKRDCWLDAAQGFSPVRYEQRLRAVKGLGHWGEPSEIGVATWIKINDAWVPKTLTQEQKYPRGFRRRELSFDWESVNQRVEPTLFTWQGMGLPNGTTVIDRRLGTTVTVATVGEDVFGPEELDAPERTALRMVLAAATLVGLAVLLGVAFWRACRTRAAFEEPPYKRDPPSP